MRVLGRTGRTTAVPHETPVVAAATDDGFVIALPYGSQADWPKNVLASGSATIVHEGHVHRVYEPEVVGIEAADEFFSPHDQRAHRFFGTDQCLRLRRTDTNHAAARSTPPGTSP